MNVSIFTRTHEDIPSISVVSFISLRLSLIYLYSPPPRGILTLMLPSSGEEI